MLRHPASLLLCLWLPSFLLASPPPPPIPEVVTATAAALAAPPMPSPPPPASPAMRAWEQGQLALENDRFDEAIGHFQLSLRLNPTLAQGHLSLAAAHLALEQDAQAVPHLNAYLRLRPTHFLVRLPFAELLTRLGDHVNARHHLQRFLIAIQDSAKLAEDHLVGCHTRLMEIAEKLGDEYGEHLERGMGLYRLALKRRDLGGPNANAQAEEMLCKAAAELTLAQMQHPEEARPCWYLYNVWQSLGQQQPAQRWLRAAEQVAGLSYLTPAERRQLHLSARHALEAGK